MNSTPSDESEEPPQSPALPSTGCLAGIDFGTVRVGVALCDATQSIASPLETYNRRSESKDAEYFKRLVADYSVVGFVIGLPLHMSGDESQKSEEARAFGAWLAALTELPIAWVDERYSTRFANDLLRESNLTAKKRKARLDKIAAQAILSTFLESGQSGIDPGPLD